jgi:Flp pilus assembly protein TadD
LLAPSALVPLLEPLSEHRAYAASLGLLLAAAAAAQQIFGARVATAAMAAVAVACVPLTLRRNALWAEPRLLWQEAAARAPDLWAAQYSLGKHLALEGNCGAAIPPLQRAAALSRGDVRAHNELARCLSLEGRNAEAYAALSAALALAPHSALTLANLAALALTTRRPDLAREYLSRAIAADPGNAARRERLQTLQDLSPDPDAPWPPAR